MFTWNVVLIVIPKKGSKRFQTNRTKGKHNDVWDHYVIWMRANRDDPPPLIPNDRSTQQALVFGAPHPRPVAPARPLGSWTSQHFRNGAESIWRFMVGFYQILPPSLTLIIKSCALQQVEHRPPTSAFCADGPLISNPRPPNWFAASRWGIHNNQLPALNRTQCNYKDAIQTATRSSANPIKAA